MLKRNFIAICTCVFLFVAAFVAPTPAPAKEVKEVVNRIMMAPAKAMGCSLPAAAYGFQRGWAYKTNAPLDKVPVVFQFMRGVNVGTQRFFGYSLECVREAVTPLKSTQFTYIHQLGPIAMATMKMGPWSQTVMFGSKVVPAFLVSIGTWGHFAGWSQSGTIAAVGAMGYIGGFPVAKFVDLLERNILKSAFGIDM